MLNRFEPSEHSYGYGTAVAWPEGGGMIVASAPPPDLPPMAQPNQGLRTAGMALGGTAILALILLPTFFVGPWAVKQFKPEWGYGKRLVTSMLVGTGIGLVRAVVAPREKPLTA